MATVGDIKVRLRVVSGDENETGVRQCFNFGCVHHAWYGDYCMLRSITIDKDGVCDFAHVTGHETEEVPNGRSEI